VIENDTPISFHLEDIAEGLDSCWWTIANHSSNDRFGCDPAKVEKARNALKEVKRLLETVVGPELEKALVALKQSKQAITPEYDCLPVFYLSPSWCFSC